MSLSEEEKENIFQNYPINNQNLGKQDGKRWFISDLVNENGVNLGTLGKFGFVQENIPSTPFTGILEIDINSEPDGLSSTNIVYNPVTVTFTNGNVRIEWNNYIRTIENVYSDPSPGPESDPTLATGSPITLIPKNFIITILDID